LLRRFQLDARWRQDVGVFCDVQVIRNTPLASLAKLKRANESLGEAAVVLFGAGTQAITHTVISRDLSGVPCPDGWSSGLLWLP
jgi:hypothetical protein